MVKQEDKLGQQILQYRGEDFEDSMQFVTSRTEYEGYTWRQLLLKLTFEYITFDLYYNMNFEIIYEFIKIFGDELDSVIIKIIDK